MTTYQTGLFAENLCRVALTLKGYRLLASRWRCPLGEIDIVAARGRTLAMIEVKARASRRAAMESLSPHQQQRLERAARTYLSQNPHFNRHALRFDVMLVTPYRWPEHIPNAWQPRL